MSAKIKIDMNSPEFQRDFFGLEKKELTAFVNALEKISRLTWHEFYLNKGLKWESIVSKRASSGDRIYSFRFSQKYRATAFREGEFLRLLALHVDHDGAY